MHAGKKYLSFLLLSSYYSIKKKKNSYYTSVMTEKDRPPTIVWKFENKYIFKYYFFQTRLRHSKYIS